MPHSRFLSEEIGSRSALTGDSSHPTLTLITEKGVIAKGSISKIVVHVQSGLLMRKPSGGERAR
ncbi:MAG: hypothetical protein ACE5L7_09600, partial [Candidatus Aminicenantales bacterium]